MSNSNINDTISDSISKLPPSLQKVFKDSTKVDVTKKPEPKHTLAIKPNSPEEHEAVLAQLNALGPAIASMQDGGNNFPPQQEIPSPIPPQVPPQQPVSAPPPSINSGMQHQTQKIRKVHPIIDSLKQYLGGDKQEIIKTPKIHGRVWGFLPLSNKDICLIDELITTDVPFEVMYDSEVNSLTRAAYVSVALRSIDDVPLYDLFGFDVSDYLINNKYDPPRELKRLASFEFYKMLVEGKDNEELLTVLHQQYERLVGKESKYFRKLESGESQYSCPECGRVISQEIRYSNNKELPFYCVYDGNQLEKVEVLSNDNLPLS